MKEENQSVSRESFQSLILIVLIVVGVGIFVLFQIKDSSFNPFGKHLLGKGVPAPNFTFPGLDGGASQYLGHLVSPLCGRDAVYGKALSRAEE
jgi:hypothetical protein